MSLLKPREKSKPKPGLSAENFFGHRLSMHGGRDQATCAYCGEVFSGIVLAIAAAAIGEGASRVKRCKAAVWAEAD